MRHIDTFTIGRFRGIQDLKLDELGQINLLVGDNNSGKTSVLEALFIYSDPFDPRKWYDAATVREVSAGLSSVMRVRIGPVDRLMWLFPQWEEQNKYSGGVSPDSSTIALEAASQFPIKKVFARYEKFFTIEQITSKLSPFEESIDRELENINISVSVDMLSFQKTLFNSLDLHKTLQDEIAFSEGKSRFLLKNLKTPSLPVQFMLPFSHRLANLHPSLWSRVVEANLKASTLDLLRSYDADIQDIDLISPDEGQLTLSVKHQKLGRAPLSTFGDGLRRIFTFATAIPQCRNGLLLIDELETAIHTKALRKTLEWLVNACVQNNVQLFATTHSLETIDAVIDASKSDSVDLVAYRLEQGETKTAATRFDKGLLTRLREDLGMEVR